MQPLTRPLGFVLTSVSPAAIDRLVNRWRARRNVTNRPHPPPKQNEMHPPCGRERRPQNGALGLYLSCGSSLYFKVQSEKLLVLVDPSISILSRPNENGRIVVCGFNPAGTCFHVAVWASVCVYLSVLTITTEEHFTWLADRFLFEFGSSSRESEIRSRLVSASRNVHSQNFGRKIEMHTSSAGTSIGNGINIRILCVSEFLKPKPSDYQTTLWAIATIGSAIYWPSSQHCDGWNG